jgi:hypothetical protein
MNDLTGSSKDSGDLTRDNNDEYSALFAQLVIQQSNMTLMLLGKIPHPETGRATQDLDAAKLFIDTLEMLQRKTKGNLTKQEEALLKQSLMSLQLAYVEAVEKPSGTGASPEAPSQETSRSPEPHPGAAPSPEQEHRPKFSKKY